MAKVSDFKSIRLKLASPDDVLEWSYGEVTKPETINYRTQKPERDGLFDEKIFGPEKDYECYCGKYRRIRYKGVVCDRCGVEVIQSSVRRERMGHIKLAVPVVHIWYLRGTTSSMGLILDIPVSKLEKVIYYNNYIVIDVDEDQKKDVIQRLDEEFKRKNKAEKDKEIRDELKKAKDVEMKRLNDLSFLSVLSEMDYNDMSSKYGEIFQASTGAEPVRKVLANMDLKKRLAELEEELANAKKSEKDKLQKRYILLDRMHKAGVRPEWMFVVNLPMIPPELRPMVQLDGGRYASSDLNDLYRRVINRNNRLKRLMELNAPEVITRNEKRMLQESVDALIDNSARSGQSLTTASSGGKRTLKSIADMLKGKQGRFRQNLLGKRVDYSGRSVIVVGPDLALYQCGLPKKMALELFRPFVIRQIIEQELAYNVRSANHLIDDAPPEVWAILEGIIKGKYVLLNRAPTLHRLGIQAFQPLLIEGNAIQLHPLVCSAYNADFDGDQMAVHLPLSDEAQEEAKNLMLASRNLIKPATGTPIVNPTKDIVLGCFWMTKIKEGIKGEGTIFADCNSVIHSYNEGYIDLQAKIKIRVRGNSRIELYAKEEDRFIETSAGRVIFNEIFPSDFPYVNEEMASGALKEVTSQIFSKYGVEKTTEVLDKMKNVGFDYSTISGVSWSMDDLITPEEKNKIVNDSYSDVGIIRGQFEEGLLSAKERRDKTIEVWNKTKQDLEDVLPSYIDEYSSLATVIDSGSVSTKASLIQMMGMKGSVVNASAQTMEIPVISSFKEGLTALEYFLSTHGARKGLTDTSLRTARAGYLTRRLVDVTQDIIIYHQECKDKKGIELTRKASEAINQEFEEQVYGRVLSKEVKLEDGTTLNKGEYVYMDIASKIGDDKSIESVFVFTPITCMDENVCARCYGLDLSNGQPVEEGEAVGVIAAQSIGEPGTQLTMRSFHSGGVASAKDVTQGLPRVEEIFEVRSPKGKAIISEVNGKVEEIKKIEKSNEYSIKIRYDTKNVATKSGKKSDVEEYITPSNVSLMVEKGDMVVAGSQLTEGHIDLRELYAQASQEEVQKRIVSEVQEIYGSHGATIHSKHVEMIARQMFSRIEIADVGDSNFSLGEIVSYTSLKRENDELEKNKKRIAKGKTILLGITKVALTTDSFLSAASFQETSRILIRASLEGRRDNLNGLKENVIIGKIIPAGTGFRN